MKRISYNKELFFVNAQLHFSRRYTGCIFSIIAADINFFSLYNEEYGRDKGDKYLEYIQGKCELFARERGGFSGYFENDNFAIFIPLSKQEYGDTNTVYNVLEDELKYAFDDEFHANDGKYPMAFGIYAVESGEVQKLGIDPLNMYARAQSAMNNIKNNYISSVSRFCQKEWDRLCKEKVIMTEAKRALRDGKFDFYVQPKCDIESGEILGCEALIRWIDSNGEIARTPDEFMPLFEKNGYVSVIDIYIWEEVCKWQSSLVKNGIKPMPCSINVSVKDFMYIDVSKTIKYFIDKYKLEPWMIEIEVTESAYSEETMIIDHSVRRLKSLGHRILIDDFGNAYSSLTRINNLTFDAIKTDLRFMDGFNEQDIVMDLILNMGKRMEKQVIIEGIETDEQKESLIKKGCQFAQGFRYYHPMQKEKFEEIAYNNKGE